MGRELKGGEVIDLVSDLGGGKTAFVTGLAKGLGSTDAVASPTFTICRVYRGQTVSLHHYDFYRLDDPGIIAQELKESIADPGVSVVIEWPATVADILPNDRLSIVITPLSPTSRRLAFSAGRGHTRLLKGLR